MRLLFSWVLMVVMFLGNAHAWNKADDMAQYWGDGTFSMCGKHDYNKDNLCLQNSGCSEDGSGKWTFNLMIATKIKEHGAYFCPIQIESQRDTDGYQETMTRYFWLGGDDNCIWLCKDGYTGDECSTETASKCFSDKLTDRYKSDKFSNTSQGNDAEGSIAMFKWNEDTNCGHNLNKMEDEHDMILVLTDVKEHGGLAQMMIFRAYGDINSKGRKFDHTWPRVYPAGNASKKLVCANGYKPNEPGTDCSPVDAEKCALNDMCDSMVNFYKSEQHAISAAVESSGACAGKYTFRCSQAGHGFTSKAKSDYTCIKCDTSRRDGIDKEGFCHLCPKGKIFKKQDTCTVSGDSDSCCVETKAISKLEMMYGKDEQQQTVVSGNKSCWLYSDKTAYKKCVEEGTAAAAALGVVEE